jgi:hypothetical protein
MSKIRQPGLSDYRELFGQSDKTPNTGRVMRPESRGQSSFVVTTEQVI